jgi:hypothetical protein
MGIISTVLLIDWGINASIMYTSIGRSGDVSPQNIARKLGHATEKVMHSDTRHSEPSGGGAIKWTKVQRVGINAQASTIPKKYYHDTSRRYDTHCLLLHVRVILTMGYE